MFCWLFQKRFYNKKDKTDVYKKPALISEVIIWFFSVNQALVAYQVNFTVLIITYYSMLWQNMNYICILRDQLKIEITILKFHRVMKNLT